MSEVEIIVTAKNLAKAAFASAEADTTALKRRAEELSVSLRRAELAAASAGTGAEQAMLRANTAAGKAAVSAKANAEAQEKLAKGEITAEEAAAAEAKAQEDAARANLAAARAAQANERAQLAQGRAARTAAAEQEAAAAMNVGAAEKMQAGFKRLAGVGKTALLGVVAGAVAVGYESVKASTRFDAAMTLIQTQAHASRKTVDDLSRGVLRLAGKVAQDPDSLAEAAYHVESAFASTGINTKKALDLVRVAAEGATVGHAKLVDVTNALTAAVASNIPGVQNLDQAMGALNATVGAGDMHMQDLADALGTGMLATVKGFGLSIKDVGAALAVFGDNNIRGAKAGTELRMAVQALAKPAAGGAEALRKLGLSSDTLAKDMQKGGLKLAMQDLVQRMHKAGVSAKEQGQIITDAFGKKAGGGINILAGQFDRLMSKYPELEKGQRGFGQSWADTQKTFSTQLHKMEDGLKALAVQIGERLTPVLSTALGWLNKHTTVLKVLAGIIGGVLLVAIGAYVVEMTAAAAATIAATWPVLAIIAAVAGLAAAVIYAWNHFKPFRQFMTTMWDGIKVAWDEAKRHWEVLVAAIMGPLGLLVVYFKHHTAELKKIWSGVWKELQKDWKAFQAGPMKDIQHGLDNVEKWWKKNGAEITADVKVAWKAIQLNIGVVLQIIEALVKSSWTNIKSFLKLTWGFLRDAAKLAWDLISNTITTVMHNIRNTITLVLDVIHGRWGKAWSDLKTLTSQGLHDIAHLITSLTSDFGNLLFNAGRNVVQGLINGIRSMIGAVGGAISNIAGMIAAHLPHSPAKMGPLSGEGSPEKSGLRIAAMLADGMTAGTSQVAHAADGMAAAASARGGGHHRAAHHHRHRQPTINQQLTRLAHQAPHLTIGHLDKAVEKLMRHHRLSLAQLTKTMQILLGRAGHHLSIKKIDGLVAEMRKQYVGLNRGDILRDAIRELERHPHLTSSQLMSRVAKDLHAKRRSSGSGSGSGSGVSDGFIGDLTWRAGGVQYTVGGAGRMTGPVSAAGGTSGSTQVAGGGGSGGGGQHLTMQFNPMHVDFEFHGGSTPFENAMIQWLRHAIRVRGGNVQTVLGH